MNGRDHPTQSRKERRERLSVECGLWNAECGVRNISPKGANEYSPGQRPGKRVGRCASPEGAPEFMEEKPWRSPWRKSLST